MSQDNSSFKTVGDEVIGTTEFGEVVGKDENDAQIKAAEQIEEHKE